MGLIINILFFFSVITLILSISYFITASSELKKGKSKDVEKVKQEDQKAYLMLVIFISTLVISLILSIIFYWLFLFLHIH